MFWKKPKSDEPVDQPSGHADDPAVRLVRLYIRLADEAAANESQPIANSEDFVSIPASDLFGFDFDFSNPETYAHAVMAEQVARFYDCGLGRSNLASPFQLTGSSRSLRNVAAFWSILINDYPIGRLGSIEGVKSAQLVAALSSAMASEVHASRARMREAFFG